tara:strand:+ start:786 stop:1022 length:237 start_codon:yes stop_codon:yes gene_type:complete
MMWTVIYHNEADLTISAVEFNGPMDAHAAMLAVSKTIDGAVVAMVKGLHKVWEPEQGWLNDNTPPCRTDTQGYDLYEV